MTTHYQFSVPREKDGDLALTLGAGNVMYLLGANGTGKSSLVSRIIQCSPGLSKAHLGTSANVV